MKPVRPTTIITRPEIIAAAKRREAVLVAELRVVHEGDGADFGRRQRGNSQVETEFAARHEVLRDAAYIALSDQPTLTEAMRYPMTMIQSSEVKFIGRSCRWSELSLEMLKVVASS